MTNKIKNDRMDAPTCGRRRGIAALLIAVGVLFAVFNFVRISSVTVSNTADISQQLGVVVADAGRSVGDAAEELGRQAGQTAGDIGRNVGGAFRDVGHSIADVFSPAAPNPPFTSLWPLLLVVLGLALIFRRPGGRSKAKRDEVYEDDDLR